MSDTLPRLQSNLAESGAQIVFAQNAVAVGDYDGAAKYVGRAMDSLGVCIGDIVDLAPDPTSAQSACDAAKAGVDE